MIHLAANYIFNGTDFIKNAFITIDSKGEILYVSQKNSLLKEMERMIFYNGIILPGFVNAHCHLELSALKGKSTLNQGLSKFINSIIKEKKTNDLNNQRNKIIEANDIMFENGISAVGDVMNSNLTIDIKTNSKIKYHNFVEVYGTDDTAVQITKKRAKNLIELLEKKECNASIAPHALYSVNKNLFDFIVEQSNNSIISIHFLESQDELLLYSNEKGELFKEMKNTNPDYLPLTKTKSDVKVLLKRLMQDSKKMILVHNVEFRKSLIPSEKDIFLCVCPKSNLNIQGKLPTNEMLKSEDNIVLGTDSLASNDTLCILEEIKVLLSAYPNISFKEALRWATYNGAKALGMEDFYGRLEAGLTPGIVLLENVDLENLKVNENTMVKRLY